MGGGGGGGGGGAVQNLRWIFFNSMIDATDQLSMKTPMTILVTSRVITQNWNVLPTNTTTEIQQQIICLKFVVCDGFADCCIKASRKHVSWRHYVRLS